jgi:hypothetical protein
MLWHHSHFYHQSHKGISWQNSVASGPRKRTFGALPVTLIRQDLDDGRAQGARRKALDRDRRAGGSALIGASTPGWSIVTGEATIGTPWASDSSAVFRPPWKMVSAAT